MDALPDINLLEQNMKQYTQTIMDEQHDKHTNIFKNLDARIVMLRKEIDVDQIMKRFEKCADAGQVNGDLKNHEFKISLLDKNLIHIASDFQLFQQAMNSVHQSVQELQEANKEVLLGKKRLNCLSCGTEAEKLN